MKEIDESDEFLINNSKHYTTPYGTVSINTNAKNVGIFLSGGLDSAVILCLIAKTFAENNITAEIQPVTVRRGNPTDIREYDRVDIYPYVEKIIAYVRKQFPTVVINDTIKEEANYWWVSKHNGAGNIGSYTYQQEVLSLMLEWKYARPEIVTETDSVGLQDLLYCEYNGVTKNPPAASGVPASEENHRDYNDSNYIPGSATSLSRGQTYFIAEYQPIRNADKRITMWLADNLGVLEDLLPITRSCEGGPIETENFTKECMQCWWCLERRWALDNYNK
jgi:hypothetical protein